VSFASLSDRNDLMTRMRALPSFVSAEDWLHTRIVHERYDRSVGVLGVG